MAGGTLYQDEDTGAAISDINVTPLVDVVLVLLIIFMVTAKLIVNRGINVDMPKTASGEEVKSTIQVTIDKQRQLYVNGEKADTLAVVKARVERMHADNSELKAIITADTGVPYGDVMQLIDTIKRANITKFALTSDPLARGDQAGGDGAGAPADSAPGPGETAGSAPGALEPAAPEPAPAQ